MPKTYKQRATLLFNITVSIVYINNTLLFIT